MHRLVLSKFCASRTASAKFNGFGEWAFYAPL